MAVVFDKTQVPPAPMKSAEANPVEDAGQSYPIGASIVPGGANFSVFSRNAENVELLVSAGLKERRFRRF